jgi:hypothetical protein
MYVPLWDSSIRIAGGGTFSLDLRGDNEWARKTAALRELRGTTLALAFEVEYSLDVVIARFFFPNTNPQSLELKLLFDELFLKSSSANFARKIQTFKRVSRQPVLSSLISPDLLKNLNEVRDIRNRFAHHPIVFDRAPEGSTEQLIGKLVCRDKEITLDAAFFKETENLFWSVKGELQKVLSVFGVNKP